MRLHHLSVSSFGPFADTQHVDFDELNDAGLFLLTGATGAGKSSLLDAVCFALYGVVPGVRGTKTLKSQHAPADAAPEVVLDVTLQGRRFVVRRSPEWTRPKKRGDGLMTEKASASILETTDGTERLLSARGGRGRGARQEPDGHERDPVPAGGAAAPGRVPDVPARHLAGAPRRARAAVPHRPVLAHRGLGARPQPGAEPAFAHRTRRPCGAWSTPSRTALRSRPRRPCSGTRSPERRPMTACSPGRQACWPDSEQAVSVAAEDHEGALAALTTSRTRYDEARARDEQRRRREQAHRTLAALAERRPGRSRGGRGAGRARAGGSLRDGAGAAARRASGPRPGSGRPPGDAPHCTRSRCPTQPRTCRRPRWPRCSTRPDGARRCSGCCCHARPRLLPPGSRSAATSSGCSRRSNACRRPSNEPRSCRPRPTRSDSRSPRPRPSRPGAKGSPRPATNARRVRDAAGELVAVREQVRQAEEARRQARDLVQDARDVVQDLTARRLAGMAAELAGALEHGRAMSRLRRHRAPRAGSPVGGSRDGRGPGGG